MRKVAIFGGTFDPPHMGHLNIARHVYSQLKLDEIRFVPTNIPPHKDQPKASGFHRLEMLSQSIASIENFTVDAIELRRTGKSYTFDTISSFKVAEKDTEFLFVIGGDMIESLSSWYRI